MFDPVLISGYGWVSPLGSVDSEFDAQLFGGHCAVRAQEIRLPGEDVFYAPVSSCDLDATTVNSPSKVPLDRGSAFALKAARSALVNAGFAEQNGDDQKTFQLNLNAVDSTRVGVFWGCGMGGAYSFDQSAIQIYLHSKRPRPTSVITTMPNSAAAELALMVKAQGASMTYSCACASSSIAIGEAMRALRLGWLDIALVGGSEAMLSPGVLACWNALRVLPPLKTDTQENLSTSRICRPFSKDRGGFAMGEGAAAFVLERADHANQRGVKTKFHLSGYATNCDATHMTHPDASGQVRVMQAALKDAGLKAEDIDYINAHATATTAGDLAEVSSVTQVFGEQVPISSTKAQFGHMLGAAGALELVACLRALEHNALPPNANLSHADTEFNLNFVAQKNPLSEPRNHTFKGFSDKSNSSDAIKHVLSNSFAFGGTNAVLIASKV